MDDEEEEAEHEKKSNKFVSAIKYADEHRHADLEIAALFAETANGDLEEMGQNVVDGRNFGVERVEKILKNDPPKINEEEFVITFPEIEKSKDEQEAEVENKESTNNESEEQSSEVEGTEAEENEHNSSEEHS